MANAVLAEVTVNAQGDALAQLLDGGFLRIYSGQQPDRPEHYQSGDMLAELTFTDPSAPNAVGGVVEFYPFGEAVAVASGRAGWFRAVARDGVTAVIDGSVSYRDANLNLDEIDIEAGQRIIITGMAHRVV